MMVGWVEVGFGGGGVGGRLGSVCSVFLLGPVACVSFGLLESICEEGQLTCWTGSEVLTCL